ACTFVTFDELWLASGLGSNDGSLYIASTAPVCTSSATTDPRRPCNASRAVCWALLLRLSTTVPVFGCPLNSWFKFFRLRLTSRPTSASLYVRSTPCVPYTIDW